MGDTNSSDESSYRDHKGIIPWKKVAELYKCLKVLSLGLWVWRLSFRCRA